MIIEPVATDPDAKLSHRRFLAIAAFIQQRTGIRMPETKIHLIEGRLMRRVREEGFGDIGSYCDHILSGMADEVTMTEFINAVTTNKTDFWREPVHFDYLARTILPKLHHDGRSHVRCWSAAASTGMEAYSMAMVLADFMESRRDQTFSILATDIDTNVLQQAWRGIYPEAALEPVPAVLRQRYAARSLDRSRGLVRIVPSLRSKITFARFNLVEDDLPQGEPMDVIFCRNVLIYFDQPTKERVVLRLCSRLRPGGYLVLGHAESVSGLDLPVQSVAHTVFRKLGS